MSDEQVIFNDDDGGWYVIDRDELENWAATLTGLILAGGAEIHNDAGDEWLTYIAPESRSYASQVAAATTNHVAELFDTAPLFDRRYIARRLELFHESVRAQFGL